MQNPTPHCVGFIMDGNRRFAKAQGKQSIFGHKQGMDVFIESIRFVRDREIPHAVYYAFSTENWQRSKTEVTYLMKLFKTTVRRIYEDFLEQERPVKVRFIGQRNDFAPELQVEMNTLESKSAEHPDAKTTIWIALSYGGRAEIVDAVNQLVEKNKKVTEESFKELLWTAEMPDPDIVVRTGGEQRLSNFLSWSSAYSELHFIDKLWPALTENDFADILQEYATRERRRGK